MRNKKIILLAGAGNSTNVVFNSLDKKFGIHLAIIEDKESRRIFLKRRIKRLGIFTVAGQIAFQILIATPLGFFSKKRIAQVMADSNSDTTDIPSGKLRKVDSINGVTAFNLIKELNPDLIIVNGTRIISKNILNAVPCKFINTHAGITPKYRGVHGTYWALVNDDIENSGVTVHFVDTGIDTGNIIAQANVIPSPRDNFSTYPALQLSAGIKLLVKAIEDYFKNDIETKKNDGVSRLWYHPTLFQYIYNRVVKKVK